MLDISVGMSNMLFDPPTCDDAEGIDDDPPTPPIPPPIWFPPSSFPTASDFFRLLIVE
jgi:hypothetical protein